MPADAEQTPAATAAGGAANGAEPEASSGAAEVVRLAASTAAERLAARGFRVAVDEVEPDAEDPAATGELKGLPRRCIAHSERKGRRCGAGVPRDDVICTLHSGRLTPAHGGAGRALGNQRRKDRIEQMAALQRMGTRAVVAAALVDQAQEVDSAVRMLCRAAASGDLNAAKALIPWINQALGNPTERSEVSLSARPADLAAMSSEQLQSLVERGRAAGLPAPPARS